MNFVRNIVVSLLVIGFAVSSASAKEYLRVLYVFDTKTTNYSQYSMLKKAKSLNKQLNKSFSNSELSDYISFTRVGTIKLDISNGGSLYKTSERYRKYKKPSSLGSVQKQFKADIVVTIMDTGRYDLCGQAIDIPWSYLDFQDPDNAFVFLNSNSKKRCFTEPYLLAHEVGHIFGLHHGKYTADYYNDSSHFYSAGYNNGYGVKYKYGVDYGTLMSRGVTRRINRFSDPSINDCGSYWYDSSNTCGNSNANAVKFIKKWAKYYNKRGG